MRVFPSLTASLCVISLLTTVSATQETTAPNWNSPVTVTSRDTLDGAVYIRGEVYIPASYERVWNVLTDYDNLKSFIPNMVESSLISDSGRVKIIFQKGRSRYFIFSKTVAVKLRVEEEEPEGFVFELEEGPFHLYQGSWTLTANDHSGILLTYQAIVKPDFFSPRFLIKRAMRNEFRRSLNAILGETRRQTQR